MAGSKDTITYEAELEALNKALESDAGVRIPFGVQGDAINYRLRLHKARRNDRTANKQMYDSDHPLWGKSVYDGLVVRITPEKGKWYVYVVKSTMGDIEPLEEVPTNGIAPDMEDAVVQIVKRRF